MPRYRAAYPPEFRRQMIDLVRAGRSPQELSREFEPNAETIKTWVKQAERDEGVRRVDVDALVRDRDQLWAEAAHFEAKGEKIHLPSDMLAALKRIQRDRQVEDEWMEPIAAWLDDVFPASSDLFKDHRTTIPQVAKGALDMEKVRLDSIAQKRIAKTLKRLGWVLTQRSNGKNWWKRANPAENSSEDHFLAATSPQGHSEVTAA
jgi:transposase